MKGIIFSGPMVRAIGEDRKCVTRRPLREQPMSVDPQTHKAIPYCGPDGLLIERIKPPYAPGDYFVKEKLFAECYASKSWNYVTYADGEEVEAEIPADWCPPINAVRTHRESGDNIPQGGFDWHTATVASMFMPEWASRYIVTLGDPVPVRLGEVDVSAMQQEGTFASLMQDPCDMAKQIKDKYRDEWNTIYPRHPWSPDRWTWAYPVRRKR